MLKSATFIQSVISLDQLPITDKPQVAIVGRSNVGKSSLINHITGRKDLARTSATAGRTETINLYDIDKRFFLVDLPGYGFTREKTKRATFANLILDYLLQVSAIKLVFVVIDAYVGPTELDIEMLKFLRTNKIPFAIIANKIDKLSKNEITTFMTKLEAKNPDARTFLHSVKTNKSIGEIIGLMDSAVTQ